MKINFLTKYAENGASSRYRTFQYLPRLAAFDFDCTVSVLFGRDYLMRRYLTGRIPLVGFLRSFIRRFFAVLSLRSSDLVIIEYELFPYFPTWFERFLLWRGCRYIIDFDDAIFHQYDQHCNVLVRWLLRNKISKVMRAADTVIVGNKYLLDYARRAGARRVELLPTVVDLNRYPSSPSILNQDIFFIGWIGSPSTAKYIQIVAPVLAELSKQKNTGIKLIGSGEIQLDHVSPEIINWDKETEFKQLCGLDVGIMPLSDDPWARGKCGLKLIQYMACGLPVVASPVGANTEIVQHGVNGFLASTTQEWIEALETLRSDPDLRRRMGSAGRKLVEEKYCLDVTAPKYIQIIEDAARRANERRN